MNETTGKYGNLTDTEQGFSYLGMEIVEYFRVVRGKYISLGWHCGIDLDMGDDLSVASGSTLKDMIEEVDILIETEVLDEEEEISEEALAKRMLAWVYK